MRIGLSAAIGVQNIKINGILKTNGRYIAATTSLNLQTLISYEQTVRRSQSEIKMQQKSVALKDVSD